jgi:hypothetical protein
VIETLVVLVCLSTFLFGCLAVVEDIDRQIEKALLDELWDEDDE